MGRFNDYFDGESDLPLTPNPFCGGFARSRHSEDYLRICEYFRFHADMDSKLIMIKLRCWWWEENVGGLQGNKRWTHLVRTQEILVLKQCRDVVHTDVQWHWELEICWPSGSTWNQVSFPKNVISLNLTVSFKFWLPNPCRKEFSTWDAATLFASLISDETNWSTFGCE